ncbi:MULTISPECIES: hypothetical protein [unclassified Thiocapsa]|uniref:hypothetical protein n=1 Tax=unclassified Thiocapsa TaxID=2641286 RepID=UPI0035B41E6D
MVAKVKTRSLAWISAPHDLMKPDQVGSETGSAMKAEAHMKYSQFCEESRYPGFYYRMVDNVLDEENWKCFVNSVYDKETKTWTCFKRAHVDVVDKSKLFK